MRSKEYFLWILSNPVSRYQLQELLKRQVLSNVMGNVQAPKGYLRSYDVFRKIEATVQIRFKLGLHVNNITLIMYDNDMSTSFLDVEGQQILVEVSVEPRL